MPVRRWDFSSWARLGRPIIREFQSPSIQSVTLIVDTSLGPTAAGDAPDATLERLLSLAATLIGELTRKLVHVRLYLTDEEPDVMSGGDQTATRGADCESLLIRMAAVGRTSPAVSDERATTVLEQVSGLPVLVLTHRPEAVIWQRVPARVTVLRVESAHPDKPRPHRSRRRNTADESTLAVGAD